MSNEFTGKLAAVFRVTGASTSKTTMPLGTADGAETHFVLGETINDCEATTLWTGTSLATDAVDYKEGTKSIKDTIPAAVAIYETKYTPAASKDLTHRRFVSFWLKCSRISTYFVLARLRLYDGTGKYNYYNLTFAAATWKRFDIDIRNPDGNGGAAPDLTAITSFGFIFDDTTGSGWTLNLDWLSYNPYLAENVIVYDNAVAVATTDYTCSPSGYITFDTAPTAAHAITASYDYYASIEQISAAYNWSGDESCELQDATAFSDEGHTRYKAGNDGWTITAEDYYVSGYRFTKGTEYLLRFYVYLDETTPIYYEGVGIVERAGITTPQKTLIQDTIVFKGQGLLYYITEA